MYKFRHKKPLRAAAFFAAALLAVSGGLAAVRPETVYGMSFSFPSGLSEMWAPAGITKCLDGGVLVTDLFHKTVWKVEGDSARLYAGNPGREGRYGEPEGGFGDGPLSQIQMKSPWDIVPYLDGYAISDRENNAVRYLTPTGGKTVAGGKTAAGTGKKGFQDNMGEYALLSGPTGLAADQEGNLYISDTDNDAIRILDASGQLKTYISGLAAPTGLCFSKGVLYVAETGNNRILKITDGQVFVAAGSSNGGYRDGDAAQAEFSSPQRITAADDGTIYVSDTGNGLVRKLSGGVVTTLPEEEMVSPEGILIQGDQLWVCDSFSRRIFVLPQ